MLHYILIARSRLGEDGWYALAGIDYKQPCLLTGAGYILWQSLQLAR